MFRRILPDMKILAALTCILALVAGPAVAQDDNDLLPTEAAKTAILTCLAEVEAEGAAMTSESTDADWAALRRPSDCVGQPAIQCQKVHGDSTMAMVMCMGGEAEGWNALMAEWMAEALTEASPARRAVIEESQALWKQTMDRSLDIYAVQRDESGGGTLWSVLYAGDYLDQTGRRALWLHYIKAM